MENNRVWGLTVVIHYLMIAAFEPHDCEDTVKSFNLAVV